MINFTNKLNLIPNKHLSLNQNWNFISQKMKIFHHKRGLNCHEWLDKDLKEKNIEKNWCGFLHNVIDYPDEYPKKYSNKILPLRLLVKDNYFLDKLNDCKGIFVFTNQIRNFLAKETGFEKVYFLIHPAPDYLFIDRAWNRKNIVLHVGQQLRKYHSFAELKTKNKKIMLSPPGCKGDLLEMQDYCLKKFEILDNLNFQDYISLLSQSIVFLDLYDVAACNTIIECIILGIPILVKKLEGCLDYLGKDYPFYFNDLKEANYKINNENIILETKNYIDNIDKNKFKINYFLTSILNYNLNYNLK
jgi:hypothetical protein